MSSRVYLGHLPSSARERDVEKFFRGYGKLREIVMKNGFGFVEFDSSRDADDAVHDLNGRELCGERVLVELSRPRAGGGRDSFGERGGRDRGGPPPRANRFGPPVQTRYRLTVENLTTRYSWQDLKDMMRNCGDVTYADAHKTEKNIGIVCFSNHRDLKRAIEKYQGKDINGRKVKLIDETAESRSRSRSRSRRRSGSASRSRSPRPSKRRSRSRSASPPPKRSKRSGSGSATPKSRSPSPKSRSGSPDSAVNGRQGKSGGGEEKKKEERSRSASRSRSPTPRSAASRSKSPASGGGGAGSPGSDK